MEEFETIHKNIREHNKKNKNDMKYLQYDGHQSHLGHYFRHLFQAVNYVNDQPFLTYEMKYSLVRTLRAQLTNHEQAIFFYNSISRLGWNWERNHDDKNMQLITKYNLIKNIPDGFLKHCDAKEYYPTVRYEGEAKSGRRKLEKSYN
jgi:hypothetical protein